MASSARPSLSLARVAAGLLAAGLPLGAARATPAPAQLVTSVGQCYHGSAGHNPLLRQIHEECPLPPTDKTPPSPDYPWTHAVRCVVAKNQTLGTEKPYCLYTTALFGGGHGASLIAAPSTASEVIANDPYEDRPSYGASGTRRFATGPVVTKDGPAYTVGKTPGKGLGVVAGRKIEQGEVLMLDFPAMLVGKKFLEDIQPKLRRRLLKRGISQLPQSTQDKIFSLAKSTGGEPIDDILGTNTCSVTMADEIMLGLYPEVARLNHACNPNSYYRFSPRTLTMEVVAYRDIRPGEEITISYTQLTLTRSARREQLKDSWNFDCACSLCRADAHAVTVSEDRRKEIRKLQGKLVETTRGGRFEAAVETAKELIETTNQEGVTPIMAEMHDILAAIYLDMKDWSNARRYGRLALESWEKLDSIDHYQLEVAHWFLRYLDRQKLKLQRNDDDADDDEEEEDD